MVILDKISKLLKEQHKTQKQLCEYIGISNNVYTDWKAGRNASYMKYLPKIADFLNVSVDYLLGKEQKEKTATNDGLSEQDREIITLISLLPEKKKERLFHLIKLFFEDS